MTREDIEAIRQELKGIKSAINILAGSDSTASSTSGNQVIANDILTTINTSLDVIEANSAAGSNPNGQATMVNSAPVVIASDQSVLRISATALPLPTGAATASGVATVNSNITSLRFVEMSDLSLKLSAVIVGLDNFKNFSNDSLFYEKGVPSVFYKVRDVYQSNGAIATQILNLDGTASPFTSFTSLIPLGYKGIVSEWQFACAAPVTTTANLTLKAADASGFSYFNYITGFQIINASVTIPTEIVIKSGSTVIWRGYVGVGAVLNSAVGTSFLTPLKALLVNDALTFACISTASSVYVNAQGYTAP